MESYALTILSVEILLVLLFSGWRRGLIAASMVLIIIIGVLIFVERGERVRFKDAQERSSATRSQRIYGWLTGVLVGFSLVMYLIGTA
jgi:uncharacterized membrane protein YfhO